MKLIHLQYYVIDQVLHSTSKSNNDENSPACEYSCKQYDPLFAIFKDSINYYYAIQYQQSFIQLPISNLCLHSAELSNTANYSQLNKLIMNLRFDWKFINLRGGGRTSKVQIYDEGCNVWDFLKIIYVS